MGLVYRGEYANPNMVELELEQMDARVMALESATAAASPTTIAVTHSRTLSASETGSSVTNEGAASAIVVTLPSAVTDLTFRFYVQVAQTLEVVAGDGDTIRIGADVTAAGGSITSNTVGHSVVLVAVNNAEWIGFGSAGTWTF